MNEEEVNDNKNVKSNSAGRRSFQLIFSFYPLSSFSSPLCRIKSFPVKAYMKCSDGLKMLQQIQIICTFICQRFSCCLLRHFYNTQLFVHTAVDCEVELTMCERQTAQVQCALPNRVLRSLRRIWSDLFFSDAAICNAQYNLCTLKDFV